LMMVAYSVSSWTPIVLMRVYHWPPDVTGLVFATYAAVVSVGALTVNGAIVDRWYAKGVSDAHLRYFALGAIAIAASGASVTFASSGSAFLVAAAPACWFVNFYGVAAAAIQLMTPPQMRGRVSAIFLLLANLLGIGLGPLATALLTNLALRDEMKLGWSVGATMLLLAPIAGLSLRSGLAAMRAAARASARSDGHGGA